MHHSKRDCLECRNLLSRVLVVNPAERATVSEIRVHPWMTRGYDGPVDNHLSQRSPLAGPLDEQVIRRMAALSFGSAEEIKQELETLIASEGYQKAAHRPPMTENDNNNSHGLFASLFGTAPSISASKDDPQTLPDAYHPLLSIYYLVQEQMEREASNHNTTQESVPFFGRRWNQPSSPAPVLAGAGRRGHHKKSASVATTTFSSSSCASNNKKKGHQKTKSLAPVLSLNDEQQQQQQTNTEKEDGYVRPVYLKGLFSMATTSTKSPSFIRSDIIRVLSNTPDMQWCETKGIYYVSADIPEASTIRFEIHIVRIAWLPGMHGLQFRRVSGDPWQYKNTCSRLLAELRL